MRAIESGNLFRNCIMSLEQRGSIYAILSGFLYGFIGYFGVSAINDHMSVSTMLFWRFLISSLIIFAIAFPKVTKSKSDYKSMFLTFIFGACLYGVSTLLYFYSSSYVGTGLSMVIFFTYPVIIILINCFFYGKSIPPAYYLALVLIFLGMFLLVDMKEIGLDLFGISLGVASSLFYACYIIASKKNKLEPNLSTLMVCLGCMVTNLIVSFYDNSLALPNALNTWINLLGISVVATVIPIMLLLHSLKYISSERASILSVLEPVFVVIFGVLLLGEQLEPLHALGVIFVLLGALITLFSNKIKLKDFTKIIPQT